VWALSLYPRHKPHAGFFSKLFKPTREVSNVDFMLKKLAATLIILGFLLTGCIPAAFAQDSNSVGVKKGYWMEYTVSGSGNLPEGHDVVWAKMEVIEVAPDGSKFWVNFVSVARNGSIYSAVRDFDFAAGDVEAWLIIPANLSPGDSFYDELSGRDITIQGESTMTIAGATRTVTYTNTTERTKVWDKATGMYVQTIDVLPDYEISANITATNVWEPQILGLNQNVFYIVMAVVVTAVVTAVVSVAVAWLIIRRRRKV
jgi:hypothetical protein